MADLTAEQIAELKRLHRAAAPQRWRLENGDTIRGLGDVHLAVVSMPNDFPCIEDEDRPAAQVECGATAALIVAARNALPSLLAEVERRRAESAPRAPDPASTAEAPDRLRDGIEAAARVLAANGIDSRAHLHLRPGAAAEVAEILNGLTPGVQSAPSPAARTAPTVNCDGRACGLTNCIWCSSAAARTATTGTEECAKRERGALSRIASLARDHRRPEAQLDRIAEVALRALAAPTPDTGARDNEGQGGSTS